jgi:hypothetical protein
MKQKPIKIGDVFTIRGCYVENPRPPKPPRFKRGELITISVEQADGSTKETRLRIRQVTNLKDRAELIVDPE